MRNNFRLPMTRRAAIGVMLAGAGAALLAACGGTAAVSSAPAASSGAPKPATSAASSVAGAPASAASAKPAASAGASLSAAAKPAASGAPKTGGTIRTGQVGDIANLDGHYANQLSATTVQLAYDMLTTYDDKLQPQPALAESWDLSSDLKTFKLTLRKGVTFHDGREFTSDDVKYNFMRVRDPKLGALVGTLAAQSAWFTDIQTPDKYSVVMTSDKTRPGFFDVTSGFRMVDKNTMEGPDAKTKLNGTGPFTFVEWVSGDHITMGKNKNYWQTGKPYIDGFRVSILKDAAAMSAQLEAGALDAMYAPSLADAARLKADPKYTAVVNPNLGQFFYMNTNTTLPLFKDKRVRQAFNYVVDRQRISQTVLRGLCGDPVSLPWPPQSPAYDASKNSFFTQNLDKATALLKDAGVSSPSFDITYSTSGYAEEFASMAQIFQSDLAKIGVKTTLKPVDGPTFTAQGSAHQYMGIRIGSGAGAGAQEASTMLQSTSAYNYTGGFPGFTDPEYTRLVDAVSSEPDAAKRKALYSLINDFLLDQSFTYAFSLYPSTAAMSAKVHDLAFATTAALNYLNAWIE
ncbi:MAG: ABC transporter substrate-binding protein [Chloroflexi bacterium]|nr:ABC transporter substrate-binding protein [Chloroflexota bacterium]